MDKSKIVVLILSTSDKRYISFKKAIEESWARNLRVKGVKCFYYQGGAQKNEIIENTIFLTANDDLKHTSVKLLDAFKLVLASFPETQLVYRTNLSSFIEAQNFLKFISRHDLNSDTYCGIKNKTNTTKENFYLNELMTFVFTVLQFFGKKFYFASGSGFFIGVNNIIKIIDDPKKLNYVDDVMIGYNLIDQPIKLIPKRFDIKEHNKHKIPLNEYNGLIDKDLLFHYRFKTKNRSNDSKNLKQFKNPNFRIEFCSFKS